jgi:hypothetical protein
MGDDATFIGGMYTPQPLVLPSNHRLMVLDLWLDQSVLGSVFYEAE